MQDEHVEEFLRYLASSDSIEVSEEKLKDIYYDWKENLFYCPILDEFIHRFIPQMQNIHPIPKHVTDLLIDRCEPEILEWIYLDFDDSLSRDILLDAISQVLIGMHYEDDEETKVVFREKWQQYATHLTQ